MNRKSFLIAIVCLVFVSFGAWASHDGEVSNGNLTYNYTGLMETPKRVSPNEDILALFTDAGIGSQYLRMESKNIPSSVNDEIDTVVHDNKSTLEELIWSNLRIHLAPGVAEKAYIEIGRNRWDLTLN